MTDHRLPGPRLGEQPPPVLGAWWWLYALVAGWLAVLIALFWAFTRAFS